MTASVRGPPMTPDEYAARIDSDGKLIYPTYYDMDGVPVVCFAEDELPKRITATGMEPVYDTFRFGTEAVPISRAEFDELCRSVRAPAIA
jgi:hypothetical protein